MYVNEVFATIGRSQLQLRALKVSSQNKPNHQRPCFSLDLPQSNYRILPRLHSP